MAQKWKFTAWRVNPERVSSNPGDRYKPTYSSYFDDDGRLCLEKVGQTDLYEEIQSYAESVDINTILARYAAGDTDALQRAQGFYFDATEVPKNTADLLNKLMKAEDEFNKMPVEFKQMYGNDFAQFICQFDPNKISQLAEDPQIVATLPKTDDVKEVDSDE